MLWVDSGDLNSWAKRRDCHGDLPFLVRSLIRATATDISKILFPAGDNVSSPGWDGVLEVSEGNEYVPEGFSIWEMGCNHHVKGKADSDYEKRKENLSGINPAETTYVFVSPRPWTKNEEWCEEKRKEGFWKDVKAYNAATLEEWIEQAPAVGIWLGQYLGKYPKGVKALVDWWDEWSMSTNPHLAAELVLAGRDKQIEDVQEKLKSPSSKITVKAATINESIAFLAAAIISLPEEEREYYLSRSIVISDSEAFKHISITGKSGLFFVPEFEEIQGLSLAIQKGHSVYIPVGPDNNITSPEIVLPRLGRDKFISALEEMGLSNEDSQKYSRDTGRSLTVLRRQLMDYVNQPEWAKADSARDIIPALLVGRWIESNKTDKEIISQIARDYDSFSTRLYSWRNQQDSPVLKIGELWRLVSAMDAFFALSPFITSDDLQRFKAIVLKVFKTLDPALELEPGERWMAAVHGKVQPYSNELREGILQTLILIAYFGDNAKISLSTSAQTWVDNIIRELLHEAECNLWMSLYDVLPLIAEASPNSFMDAVESSLSGGEKPIMCLFEETKGITGPSSNHSSLLWALEHLSWSLELLPRVTLILGKLASYDPYSESIMINRPKNSLREIFLLWHPQTYASLKKRLEVLDLLIEKYPDVGWNLLIDLLPKSDDVGHPTSKPIWRQFTEKTEVLPPTIAEHYASIKEIVDRLLTYVGYDGQLWVKILENFPDLPVDQRNRIFEQLSSDVDKILNGRYELWNKLRKVISRHRSYPDTDWALPEEELKDLEDIYSSLEPKDTIDRLCWLFDGWPDLLEGVKIEDHDDNDEHFVQLRIAALNEIKDDHGFEGLINLSERIEYPFYIGRALAEDDIDLKEEDKLYSLLEEADESQMIFVKEYIFRKAFNDKEWTKNLVNKARTENWSDLKIVNCFTALPSRMFVWDLLNHFNESIQEAYWKKCSFGGITRESEDKIYFVEHMAQAKRYFTALGIAALYAKEMTPELIAEVLEKTATEKSEDKYHIKYWDIEKLFKELYKSEYPKSEIAKLELKYIPILASVGSRRAPKMLHDALANDPEFFAEIIRYIYKRKDGKQDEGEEKITQKRLEQRGKLSWRLIKSWKTIPCSGNNGQIDYEKLKSWIDKARELCEKSDRITACDKQIGKVLAYAEPEDEIWPPEAVCKIIESIESEELHRGFKIGTENKRGTTMRALDEGGKQEAELANKFRGYAEILNTRFPKTASILNSIAEDYENEAKIWNEEVEKRDLDY